MLTVEATVLSFSDGRSSGCTNQAPSKGRPTSMASCRASRGAVEEAHDHTGTVFGDLGPDDHIFALEHLHHSPGGREDRRAVPDTTGGVLTSAENRMAASMSR